MATLDAVVGDGVWEVEGPEDLPELRKVFLQTRLVDEQMRVVEVDHRVAQQDL